MLQTSFAFVYFEIAEVLNFPYFFVQPYGIPGQFPDNPGCKASINISVIVKRINFVIFSEIAFYVLCNPRGQETSNKFLLYFL